MPAPAQMDEPGSEVDDVGDGEDKGSKLDEEKVKGGERVVIKSAKG